MENCKFSFDKLGFKSRPSHSMEKIRILKGANMDIDLLPAKVHWEIGECPWNKDEGKNIHKCAVKNVSICKYFRGVQKLDKVLCAYPANSNQK